MQLSRSLIVATIALAASAAASPSADKSSKDVSAKNAAASLMRSESADIQKAVSQLKKLHSTTAKVDKKLVSNLKPVFHDLNKSLKTFTAAIEKLDAKAKRGIEVRQTDLVAAVHGLNHDLNVLVPNVLSTVRHLTKNLRLGTVQDLVDGLTPTVKQLVAGVEGLLNNLAPGLAGLLDPVLDGVKELTAALGINLDLPSSDILRLDASSNPKHLAIAALTKVNKDIEKNADRLAKVDLSKVDDKTVAELKPIFKDLVSSLKQATKSIAHAKTLTKGKNDDRQTDLVGAVTQLEADLDTVLLPRVNKTVRHLTRHLHLGTVQALVDGLSPTIVTLVGGVEALLTSLAPGLAGLLDPVLDGVKQLTASLGINLNLPSA